MAVASSGPSPMGTALTQGYSSIGSATVAVPSHGPLPVGTIPTYGSPPMGAPTNTTLSHGPPPIGAPIREGQGESVATMGEPIGGCP